MARIKCKNCGKVYRYETEGCCPECGAYNRPPRREQVNADGTIYHMNGSDYIEVRHAQAKSHDGKVCFEKKECHEEKVCYEQKTHSAKPHVAAVPVVNQFQKQRKAKKNTKSVAWIVVAIVVLAGAIGNIMESLSSHFDYVDYDEPYLVQFNYEDGIATAYLEDASDVKSGTLCYYNEDNEFCTVDMASIETYDDQCKIVFYLDDTYQYAESVDVTFGDTWRSLWIDDESEDSEHGFNDPVLEDFKVEDGKAIAYVHDLYYPESVTLDCLDSNNELQEVAYSDYQDTAYADTIVFELEEDCRAILRMEAIYDGGKMMAFPVDVELDS